MSLDALAPDQRAVVQLVLQQGRSYADLAGMLQIAEPAVRDRARRGLVALAAPGDLDETEQGEVVDYLLSQGSPSAREATRSLLRSDAAHNAWAAALTAQLSGLPNAQLPDVPELVQRRRRAAAPAEPGVPEDAIAAGADPTAPGVAPPEDLGSPAAALGADVDAADLDDEPAPAVRARPRPARAQRPARDAGAAAALGSERDAAPNARRSSRVGGALLLGVIAIAAVVAIVIAVTGGNDNGGGTDTASGTPAPSATASAQATPFRVGNQRLTPQGAVPLAAVGGGDAQGQLSFFVDSQNQENPTLTFFVQATGLDPQQAYAIWLLGGGDPYRVGYISNDGNETPVIANNGTLEAVQGPAAVNAQGRRDARRFTNRIRTATQIVMSRETSAQASQPGQIILSADLGAAANATPTATP